MAQLPTRRRGQNQNLTVYDPGREFEDIYNRMGQLMNLALGDVGMGRLVELPWAPPADISETDDAYIIRAELPGISKDQVEAQMQDRELVISGEVKEDTGKGRRHRSSRRTGRFEYRAFLPSDIKADQVNAQLSDGVLTVTVPKSEKAKPRKIEITG
jgi:HSP20 family protein